MNQNKTKAVTEETVAFQYLREHVERQMQGVSKALCAHSEKRNPISDGFESWWQEHCLTHNVPSTIVNPGGFARMVWMAANRHRSTGGEHE